MKKIKIFSPATIANFIVGFDSLGASLEAIDDTGFGDYVELSQANNMKIEIAGQYVDKLPQKPEDNIVSQCLSEFNKKLISKNLAPNNVSLKLEKNLPVCSGLGSSASSIVAAIFALNVYYGEPFSTDELLLLAAEMEAFTSGAAHYDNVTPCLLGGLRLMMPGGKSKPLPWFKEWLAVVYYPGVEVHTQMAREILPKQFPLASVVEYWQKLACFVDCLYTNDRQLAQSLLDDSLIEPFRSQLIPGFDSAKQAVLQEGGLAFGISGSGPTVFCLVSSQEMANKIQSVLEATMPKNNNSFSKICRISDQGTRIA